jgi:hypothetical protein
MRRRIASVFGAIAVLALLAASSGATRGVKEGGTFRVGIVPQAVGTIDAVLSQTPAPFVLLDATCASVMRKPDKSFPEGNRVVPELAVDFPKISDEG